MLSIEFNLLHPRLIFLLKNTIIMLILIELLLEREDYFAQKTGNLHKP